MPNTTILYTDSLDNARHCNEVDLWRASNKANVDCARAIENAISKDFNNNHLDENCAKSVIDEFGFDRVNFILKCTLKKSKDDLRFSDKNRDWGANTYIVESNNRDEYRVNVHPAVLDGFINQARREWAKLGLWDSSHCIESNTGLDYEGKVLVIRPSKLKDCYKTPDDQLFIATSGFGCNPNAIGRCVYGYFAKDGEECSWNRSDFIGVLKDEYIPDFVREKLNETNEATETLDDGGISMS
jgi:hypothetical protein